MEQRLEGIVSLPSGAGWAEERMLRGDLVREIIARNQLGEGIKRIARELGVDRSQDGQALAVAGQVAAAAKPPYTSTNQAVCRIYRAAGAGGRRERGGAALRIGRPGLYWQLSAGTAFS